MNKIGIIGAMEMEVSSLQERLSGKRVLTRAGIDFHEGEIAGRQVVVARSGVGKVNAALCAQIMADLFQVEAIINTGAAGSLDASIDIGDIVLSTDAVQHDVDACLFGYEKGQVPQMPLTAFPCDASLRALAGEICRKVNPDIHVHEGRIASGDQFIADRERKEEIRRTFGARAAEMEGAAIAQASYVNGIPCLIIRAISDKADGSDMVDYPVFEKAAARHSARLVLSLVEAL